MKDGLELHEEVFMILASSLGLQGPLGLEVELIAWMERHASSDLEPDLDLTRCRPRIDRPRPA